MAIYAYTDVITGYEQDGVRPKKVAAGEALVASKESGLTKEDIDELVERGAAGEKRYEEVQPNDTVPQAASLEEQEEGTDEPRSTAGR